MPRKRKQVRTGGSKGARSRRTTKGKSRTFAKRTESGRPYKSSRRSVSIRPLGDVWVAVPPDSSSARDPKDVHVVVSASGHGWTVRKSGAVRGIGTFGTREEAIAHARDLAKHRSTQVYVHRQDGRVSDVYSYVKEDKGNYK